jgi:hypothetical protein
MDAASRIEVAATRYFLKICWLLASLGLSTDIDIAIPSKGWKSGSNSWRLIEPILLQILHIQAGV